MTSTATTPQPAGRRGTRLPAVLVIAAVSAVAGAALATALLSHVFAVAEGRPESVAAAAGEAPAPAAEPADSHDHGAEADEEPSDLDLPLAALAAAQCEHDKLTRTCAECRYEVGFVRVPSDLLEAGLVRTVPVESRAIGANLLLTGEIRYDERRIAHITPVVEGVVREVHVGLMDRAKAGDPLFTMDSAALGDAQSAWLEARAVLRLEQRSLRRTQALREKRIASEREFLAARAAAEQAAIRVEAARDRLLRLGLLAADIEAIREGGARGRMVVRAPLDGRVLDLHLVAGEVVGPAKSVLLLGDLGRLWMWVDLYERDLQAVLRQVGAGGLDATVSVEAFPDRAFVGAVDIVGATMNEATRTVPMRIVLDNTDELLRPGMFGEARVAATEAPRSLTVPADAILTDAGRDFVFVRFDGEDFVRRPVLVVREEDGRVAVQAELEPGQEVVSTGAFLLKSDVLREKMGAGCAD